jgi:hypothetical protein
LQRFRSVFVQKALNYRNNGTKRKSSDAGRASKPKRSRDVHSISEKVKILDMMEIKKNRTWRLPGCVARKNLPFVKG